MLSAAPILALALALALAAVVGADVWATRVVRRREPDAELRRAQIALVWLAPFAGALLVGLAHAKAPELPAHDRTATPNRHDVTGGYDPTRHQGFGGFGASPTL